MQADPAVIVRTVLAAVPHDLRAAEAVLDAVVTALCLQLVRVQARISASAPVARLPDDVLAQIFSHACRTPPNAPHAATSATAAVLAGTSRRWRTLMLGHPALWTRIDLRHPSGTWALRYSRRLPIHVRLDAPLWKDARDGPLARVLAPHVPRLRQLWVQTGAPHAEKFLHAIAGQTQLERLTLTGRYTDEHAIGLPPALFARLRHLSLTHAHLAPTAPLPRGLLTLALKPPPATHPLLLTSLTALLRANPGLTELALHGSAVPVYKSPGDEDPAARADLARLRSLRVSGVGPVQVAWLLFHIAYPASANLMLEMELPRALRTSPHDRPRAPHELESYLAALTLFSGEPRERGMPLDTVIISPAASTSTASTTAGTQPPSPTGREKHAAPQITMEKLAAQYNTTSATLTLQAGSRATEALVRLIAAGTSTGTNGMSKLALSGVKIRQAIIESVSPGQEGLAQVRTLEIRACSLAATGVGVGASTGGFIESQRLGRSRAQTQSVPPALRSTSPTPYSMPSTPIQQESTPPTPQLGPTHPPQRSQTFNSYTYGSHPYAPASNRTGTTSYISPLASTPLTTPNLPGASLSTRNIPGVRLVPNAPPAPTPGVGSAGPLFGSPPAASVPNVNGATVPGTSMPLSNLHIPVGAARIDPVALTPSTPTQAAPYQTEHQTPRAYRGITKQALNYSDPDVGEDTSTVHAPSEGGADESVYSADTTLASAGTGSRLGSDLDEDEDENENENENEKKKDVGPGVRVTEVQIRANEKVKPEGLEEISINADIDDASASSSSEDEWTQRGNHSEESAEGDEEDETDSNEADGGSELGDLSLDDDPIDGTITPGGRSVRDRPGTPGLRGTSRAPTETGTGTGGSTSSVNGGTTPRMSGASTPKMTVTGANAPDGVPTPNLNPHLHNLRSSLHSVSMSNLRTAATRQNFSAHQHSASSSNLRATFKAKGAQDSHGTSPYAQDAFGSSGPNHNINVSRGRSTMPTPKQGGFASYANGMAATAFGAPAPNTASASTSQHSTFPATSSSRPSFHTFRAPGQTLQTAPRDDDPDSRLLSILSFHMPALEEIRIVRSTIRGSALVRFVEARNGAPNGYDHGYDDDNHYEDTDSGTGSDSEGDLEKGLGMAVGGKKTRPVRAGPGTPILSVELFECPYVTAEHVRVLRESVDDVRWKPYTLAGGG